MELEEMKKNWQEVSKRIENQEILTHQLLEKMTRDTYSSKINKIGYSEYAGTIICYIGAAYLIMNFTKIGDVLMQVFAVVAILLLFILPVLSLKSLRALQIVNISSKTYLEAIEDFGNRKIKFHKLQKVNVSLGFFLLLVALPVLSAIQGKELVDLPHFWTLIFPISITFFLAFAYWVLRSYNKLLIETEKILSDLNV